MFLYKYYLEIKNRVFLLVLSWVCLLITCWFYKETLLCVAIKSTCNLNFFNNFDLHFICTNVKELFNVYLELVFFIANQLCFIEIIYHLFMFFYLGLYLTEYVKVKKVFAIIVFCFLCAIITSYTCIIPLSWYFFLSFQQKTSDTSLVPFFFEAKISECLDFIIQIYITCLLGFQILGFSLLLLNKIFTEVNVLKVKHFRKVFYFVCILVSTVATPPDLFSQILTSLILISCYEFFILIKIFNYFIKINEVTN